MNHWIFQAVPRQYDLRTEPSDAETVAWNATRYRSRMEIGDLVFFWLGGPPDIRGIYGWGYLKSKPYQSREWDGYAIDVNFQKRLRPHVQITSIKERNDLANLQILNIAVGSNFYISKEEARALADLMPASDRPPEV
jgi:predicted RNA-binding protein with PUA-like domain